VAGVYGYEVSSEIALARLRPGGGNRGRLSIELAREEPLAGPAEIVSLIQGPDDEPVFAVARTPGALLTWCEVTGSARIDAGAGHISVSPRGDPDSWEDRLLSTVIPLLLAERGELLLHACAVQAQEGAVVVCGPSGRGKSTLAAVLGACGLPILAEDEVALSLKDAHVLAWPGPAGVRLDRQAACMLGALGPVTVRGKQLHFPSSAPSPAGPVPVAAIIALEPRGGTDLAIRPLDGPGGLAEIFLSVARLELTTWAPAFRGAAEVVRRVPCHAARLPDDLGRVAQIGPALVAAVIRDGLPA
jgi:hypothetical protein